LASSFRNRPPARGHEVLLALGANVGNRRKTLRAAVERLGCWLTSLRASSLYLTAPRYVEDQPSFLNMAVCGRTMLSPFELLAVAQAIENGLGRIREQRYGPRTIDIDIIYYGSTIITAPRLVIPHPLRAERRFVLAPLAEIAPDFIDPVTGLTVRAMLEALPVQEGDCLRTGTLDLPPTTGGARSRS
jgi:2-amino-4-hydroxy-6-hydroxymethyldihydropteridine diphosphokinase